MYPEINIITFVDVLGALSKRTLDGFIYMVDSSWTSEGQGTARLKTACYPGQRITWKAYAIDVQTPIEIKKISFYHADDEATSLSKYEMGIWEKAQPTMGEAPRWYYWTAVVPSLLDSGEYAYKFKVQMGKGSKSVMHTVPSLDVQCLPTPQT